MTKTENVASEAGFADYDDHHMHRTADEEHPSYAELHLARECRNHRAEADVFKRDRA
jgi:hypothetical protein